MFFFPNCNIATSYRFQVLIDLVLESNLFFLDGGLNSGNVSLLFWFDKMYHFGQCPLLCESEWSAFLLCTMKPTKLRWQPWLESFTGVPSCARHCKIPHRSAKTVKSQGRGCAEHCDILDRSSLITDLIPVKEPQPAKNCISFM